MSMTKSPNDLLKSPPSDMKSDGSATYGKMPGYPEATKSSSEPPVVLYEHPDRGAGSVNTSTPNKKP